MSEKRTKHRISGEKQKKLRVAAYCRVSTLMDAQDTSFELQCEHYRGYITGRELPQIFNILMGDMSIVGPRPERPEIAEKYEMEMPEFALRLQAKAGLTGLAQVYGKYNTTPYNKLQMDLQYISSMGVVEDLKIMFATVKILFMPESTEGVADGQTTAISEEKK